MNYRIAIIGGKQPVARVLAVSKEFEDGFSFFPVVLENEKELPEIIKNNRRKADGWLFSGPLPYNIAKKYFVNIENVEYCGFLGAGFYSNCMQVSFEQKVARPRISVDMLDKVFDVEHAVLETNLPMNDVFVKYYEIGYRIDDIIDFHCKLWQEGRIDAAITSLASVYNILKQKNIPAYYLVLTKEEIKQSLKIITEKLKTSYFKNTQVASVIISLNQYADVIEKVKSLSALQTLEWKLKGILLPLCNSLDGYLIEKGTGIYGIFTSRGVVEQQLQNLRETMEKVSIELNFDISVSVGIGFGETVAQAEFNANRALQNTRSKAQGLMIVSDEGGIVEVNAQRSVISYDYYSNDEALLEKLHQAAVGIKTLRKLEAVVAHMKTETFTVVQLANKLGVTEQNIRRILGSLCRVDLVQVVGEELSANRGRPGKIYKLNF